MNQKEPRLKEKYKVLFSREDDINNNVVSLVYWLSDGFDQDFKKFTKEINSFIEPELIDVAADGDKAIKYRAICHKTNPVERVPKCFNGKKVVEVVVDKNTQQRIFVRNVWKNCNTTKFSLFNYDKIVVKEWKPRTVKEAAEKWKYSTDAAPLKTPICERFEQHVDSIVNMMFKIDPSAIADDVNKTE